MSYIIGGHSGTFDSTKTQEEAVAELQNWIDNDLLSYLGIRLHSDITVEDLDNAAFTELTYIQLGIIDGILTFICY